MTNDDVGKALRRLPRTAASPRFKSDVIRAVSVQQHPRMMSRLIAATAMILLVVGTFGASIYRQRQQRINALRAETQRIESELQRVKAIADESEPIVVLENGDTRVIVSNQQSKPIYY